MAEVQIHLPPVSEGRIEHDLRWITELLDTNGLAEKSGGFLGGEYGYGAWFDNDTFTMHPYCWCERADCAWCRSCECVVEDQGDHLDWNTRWITVETCVNCAEEERTGVRVETAPNFLHKPSGSSVSWYKYIGRGMGVDLAADWRSIIDECVASLGVSS